MAPSERFRVIDGLRGVAILLVIWYHLWIIDHQTAQPIGLSADLVARTGFIGVNLFFFLSGFVIFYPFARALIEGTARPSFRAFYSRRFFKIEPSYLLAIAAAIALGWATFNSPRIGAAHVATHLLFLHSLHPKTFGSINGVLWSLAIEVQFYAIFPLVWLAAKRFGPTAVFCSLSAFALAYRTLVSVLYPERASFLSDQLPGAFDLFAAGMACVYVYLLLEARRPALAGRRSMWTALALGSAACLVPILLFVSAVEYGRSIPSEFHGASRTAQAVIFFGIALGTLLATSWWKALIGHPLLVFLAAISYNVYLWHQEIFVHSPAWFFRNGPAPEAYKLPLVIFNLAAAILVGAALTYFFERPIINVGRRLSG